LQQANLMAKSCNSLVDLIVNDITQDVESIQQLCQTDEQQKAVSSLIEKLKVYNRPFHALETEYGFKSYLEKSGYYIAPLKYVVGSTTASTLRQDTGYSQTVMTNSTGQYIPIASMIKALHSNTDLIAKVLSVHTSPDDGEELRTFFDGLFWKRHPLFNEKVIMIKLYGDDFEPGNPLGSHKTLYKIGAVYYQFEGLTLALNSKVENTFLALCYYTEDVKRFGWENVLKPLLCELRTLESDGMNITFDDNVINVRVVVSCITGDNLFLNSILGYTESFSANYPCRHCSLHRELFATNYFEDSSVVRTADQYNEDIRTKSVKQCGIKSSSPLNLLKYFHAADNFVQDLMHDVLEGICKYDMNLVLNSLLKSGRLSLDHLNGLIDNFSYGKHDITNKPVLLSEHALRSDTLPLDASQTWCITRILSLAVGSCIPRGDKVWEFYLHLRSILDVLFAPSVCKSEMTWLRVMIAEYLEMHCNLFPNETLKNKHHHLIHYPRLMLEMGPLYHLWCMRFESKHQRAKSFMNMSCNFKNVPLSVSSRHQYDVAYRLLAKSKADSCEIKLGHGVVVLLSDVVCGKEISLSMGNIGLHFELYECSMAEIAGTVFTCGCYLLTGVQNETPLFAKLRHIFSRNQGDHVWFICDKINVEYFEPHYHAWKVSQSWPPDFVSIDPRQLKHFLPLTVHFTDGASYIAGLRYRI
jgi:hypothetical protein